MPQDAATHTSPDEGFVSASYVRSLWKGLRGFMNSRVGKASRVSSSDFLIRSHGSRICEWVASRVRPLTFVGVLGGFDREFIMAAIVPA